MDVHKELQKPGQCCIIVGQTLDQCKQLCIDTPGCKAIEYGVAYGGSGRYQPGDCHLQSSGAAPNRCDGRHHNLDLHTREGPGGVVWQSAAMNSWTLALDLLVISIWF